MLLKEIIEAGFLLVSSVDGGPPRVCKRGDEFGEVVCRIGKGKT